LAPASANAVPMLCANEPTPSTMTDGRRDGFEFFPAMKLTAASVPQFWPRRNQK
jgi:hypothetical protein